MYKLMGTLIIELSIMYNSVMYLSVYGQATYNWKVGREKFFLKFFSQ